jgi:hypothetical protein
LDCHHCSHSHDANRAFRLWTGILARAAADPDFMYKVSVECGVDAIIIASVNYGARGDSFFDELEFVLCQVRFALLLLARHVRIPL